MTLGYIPEIYLQALAYDKREVRRRILALAT